MLQANSTTITVSELRTYLYSLDQEKNKEIANAVRDYKTMCNANMIKIRKKEIAKIEKNVEKSYIPKFKKRDEILNLLDRCKDIPKQVEELEIAEYMLYRVDLRKAEKIINRVAKKLGRKFEDIQEEVDKKVYEFPDFDELKVLDYREYQVSGDNLANTKEQYKLEYTEEQKNKLIEKELEIVAKVKEYNTVPIPHEILKNSDKDIQSNMQKFNTIRQKKIKILSGIEEDYKKLIEPRELLSIIDEAILNMKKVQDILTKNEYVSIKKALLKRRKKVYRNTRDIRYVIESKEKKAGIDTFNIQEARYVRMEELRKTITNATSLIKANPIEELENQLEKLKSAYKREKQFASVIEKLDNGMDENSISEVRVYEEQIASLETKLANSRKIVAESQEKIKNAKQELLVLWKMEISMVVNKKKDFLELPSGTSNQNPIKEIELGVTLFKKLKKTSKGKHAMN